MFGNVYCPKCKSRNVEDVITDKLPKPKEKSIDELVKQSGEVGTSDLVMRYFNHRVTCLGCGYSREYTD